MRRRGFVRTAIGAGRVWRRRRPPHPPLPPRFAAAPLKPQCKIAEYTARAAPPHVGGVGSLQAIGRQAGGRPCAHERPLARVGGRGAASGSNRHAAPSERCSASRASRANAGGRRQGPPGKASRAGCWHPIINCAGWDGCRQAAGGGGACGPAANEPLRSSLAGSGSARRRAVKEPPAATKLAGRVRRGGAWVDCAM